jgi:hypothetical protein
MLPGRPPQVTFSCDTADSTCDFQFWTAQVESFYCALDSCSSENKPGYDANTTVYACDHIKCSCIPGRFICGEDGSVGKPRSHPPDGMSGLDYKIQISASS